MPTIRDNLLVLRQRIGATCVKIKRDPATITLVAVAKNRSTPEIREALEAGITDIGENRVQEAVIKYQELSTPNLAARAIRWHLVGHLQTNKVREAVRIFDFIHSVDSLRLAQEIDKQAARLKKVQDILIEVNTSGEASKFGVHPKEAAALIKEARGLVNIKVRGFMTIAPIVDDPEKARPYFRMLKELKDKINQLTILSMGMTGDFEVAIEEGADIIRLGRAIFEG